VTDLVSLILLVLSLLLPLLLSLRFLVDVTRRLAGRHDLMRWTIVLGGSTAMLGLSIVPFWAPFVRAPLVTEFLRPFGPALAIAYLLVLAILSAYALVMLTDGLVGRHDLVRWIGGCP
jgi:hypothetical protein